MKRVRMAALLILCLALCAGCGEVVEIPNPYADIPWPTATITLRNGDVMRAELYPAMAPNTVSNFVVLANSGFYDGLAFDFVYPNLLIRGGDPQGDGTGNPGYTIGGEFAENGDPFNTLSHTRGVLSMARLKDDYNSAGSQFFIMQGMRTEMDGYYAAFGKLIGEDSYATLDAIAFSNTDRSYRPMVKIIIDSIRVDTKGYDYEVIPYEPPEEEMT